MKYDLFKSVDEMLATETLSALTGRVIRKTHVSPMTKLTGISGSRIIKVITEDTSAPHYVMKQMRMEWDWVMRVTNDTNCRSVALWQSGLLDCIRPHAGHGIIAAAYDGSSYALLMEDVSTGILPWGSRVKPNALEQILHAMAKQHATFWEQPQLMRTDLGLCEIERFVRCILPNPSVPEPQKTMWETGRDLITDAFEQDVATILISLMDDLQPLCAALVRYPHTMVHGDYRTRNLSYLQTERPRLTVLDWQLTTASISTLDLAFFIEVDHRSPGPPGAIIECYHHYLSQELGTRLDTREWQAMLALGMLTTVLRCCCATAYVATQDQGPRGDFTRAKLGWWSDWVRAGEKWL